MNMYQNPESQLHGRVCEHGSRKYYFGSTWITKNNVRASIIPETTNRVIQTFQHLPSGYALYSIFDLPGQDNHTVLTRMITSGLLKARSAKATRDFCPPITNEHS